MILTTTAVLHPPPARNQSRVRIGRDLPSCLRLHPHRTRQAGERSGDARHHLACERATHRQTTSTVLSPVAPIATHGAGTRTTTTAIATANAVEARVEAEVLCNGTTAANEMVHDTAVAVVTAAQVARAAVATTTIEMTMAAIATRTTDVTVVHLPVVTND